MPSVYNELLDRLIATEKEIFTPLDPKFTAHKKFPYFHPTMPYVINRLGRKVDNAPSMGRDFRTEIRTVLIHLVFAHWKQGYSGEVPNKIYDDFLPAMYAKFDDTFLLTNATYTSKFKWLMIGLEPELTDEGVQVVQYSGIPEMPIGVMFTLALPMFFSR